ncbi:MAG: hypothetical protein U0X20_22055 [Caldilineaceae bacterium]
MPNRSAPPVGRLITTATAAALAAQRGTPVKSNTILVAARRGQIEGAVKPDGRWKFPAWAFDEWLLVHTSRPSYNPDEETDAEQETE